MKKLLILCLISFTIVSAQTKVGSTAAPFLTLGYGPKAISMGGAFVTNTSDVSVLYWNPAGVARMERNGASFSYTNWFADISYNWVGIVMNMNQLGALGLSFTYLDYGKMEVTTIAEQEGTGEFFAPKDMAFGLTYSYNLTDRFSFGITAKYVNQQIWHESASGFATDFGVLYLSDIYGIRIAATIANFGTDMQLDGKDLYVLHDLDGTIYGNNDQILASLRTEAYPLPLTFRVGLSKDFMINEQNRITVAADANHPNDNAESVNFGGEYSFNNNIFIRAGYKSAFLTNSEEGLCMGFGLRYEFSPGLATSFDYAYQDFGNLSYTQHFGIGVQF
jgi:long-subunit fatty acid transport protein